MRIIFSLSLSDIILSSDHRALKTYLFGVTSSNFGKIISQTFCHYQQIAEFELFGLYSVKNNH